MTAHRIDPAPQSRPLKSVDVIIPSFRRNEGLRRAAASVFAQSGLEDVALTLILCDNSPEGSAAQTIAAIRALSPLPVLSVHEPDAGVANARNAAMRLSKGQFVAFLDDDEEAPHDWLSHLLTAQAHFDADLVFGPVNARLPDETIRYAGYFRAFFSRRGPDESGLLEHYYGCGNSMIRKSVLDSDAPFAATQNEMGGEDDILFTALMAKGVRMAWAADAPVFEDVPPRRATLDYTLKRGFAYGQGPSHVAGTHGRLLKCAYWMAKGVAQAVIMGGLAAAAFLIKHPSAAALADKAARGAGKVLWFPPFKMKFYGAQLLKAPSESK